MVQVSWEAKLNDKTIRLTSVPGGDLARIEQPDGRVLAVGVEVLGQTDQNVLFRLLEIKTIQGNEIIKQVEKFSVKIGAVYSTVWNPELQIRAREIKKMMGGGPENWGLASTGPVTNDLIQCVVTDHQRPIRITSRGNDLVRFRVDDRQWGFVPTLKTPGEVEFRVFSIHAVDSGKEILRERESFGLKPGASADVKFLPDVSIKLSAFRPEGPDR
jgi:hypothetical protein